MNQTRKTLTEKLELLLTKKLQHNNIVSKITELEARSQEIMETIDLLKKENYKDETVKTNVFLYMLEES
jgi:type IV secretory pathway VirB4 component